MKKTLLSISLAVSAALLLTACKTTEPYYSYSFEPNAQIQRAWHRIDAKDIGVEQVRVVKIIDLDCAGDRIAIPGEGEFSDLRTLSLIIGRMRSSPIFPVLECSIKKSQR